ncbi:D-alanyl-D-alanine carboxypeptidase/D-alanyl-D-alanine endopeptidase [Streptomyces tsukubensis]|uniref:D-alanyl-D-alanine carboxypeptidase/D-alanyl-D-alanine-endopeptidase n=1 Tax=Streptomyces tsukubensis (strain DSM 42081 / NBRC 108919 / NRRL 18488 / 9993) TaxID=1114943 RepID=A0A7G3UH61_STRT9|nr:D-alanyl-D-alanine carboxypeptidase/D-alanyl-D-alanine-endopeptidase [Streptomyces tsukubensis]AZK95688.1 D-alanyl-D-alanine carboxypeptidase/D-alanyl-D-alanine-endopeptidase [Streptomyces tsukubensis]QKM68282.1 D-alanyl-D-alanine carboxypeptidase/D-alanyl-D-alanine-endopeptidase [Streptomyces tsukubensis NRRL18488]TAI43102.1 D-alanyl-D-alanine carboxypeptidase/D-alanyl-D-alanine-endopeptidase [Streptomyces tsukubensis]
MPDIRTWQLATGAAVLGLVLAAGAVTAAGPWESGRRTAELDRAAEARTEPGGGHRRPAGPAPAPSAPPVLTALGTAPAPATAGRGEAAGNPARELARRLEPLLRDRGLGPRPGVSVVDLTTGRELYGRDADRTMIPASTVKIATAAAALSALGPYHRIPTTVSATPDARTLTLVGGGDATLDRAGLRTLARRTAGDLRARKVTAVTLGYDTSAYRGPDLHPIGVNGNIARVTPLMVDQGRTDPGSTGAADRVADPAGDAARVFRELLEKEGIAVGGDTAPGRPAAGSKPLTEVLSPPLADVVEQMLTRSDNDIAESLARQTAIARHEEPSFAGAGRAVQQQLAVLKVPLAGARFADGSGLDRAGRVTPRLLTALLTRAAEPAHPGLRPVLTGLPVGGFTGTLESRHTGTAPGSGLIRAKTGTLTGVNALSGTVPSPDGTLLGFAFLANETRSPTEAQPALDRLTAALTS